MATGWQTRLNGLLILLTVPGTGPEALRADSGLSRRGPGERVLAASGRPVAGEPVPVGCHAFAMPVEPPPPATARARRAALPRGATASTARLPGADQRFAGSDVPEHRFTVTWPFASRGSLRG
jgi:hypothetical protein